MSKIRKKCIRINGKTAKADTKLHYKDTIDFVPSLIPFLRKDLAEFYDHKSTQNPVPSRTQTRIEASSAMATKTINVDFPILYQNRDFLCLEKQQDKSLFGTKSITDYMHSLQRENNLRQGLGPHLGFRPGPCHRLDRNTSGILLCAKSLAAARKMQTLQSNNALLKIYFGILEVDSKEIEKQKKLVLEHDLYRSAQNISYAFPPGKAPEAFELKKRQLRYLGRGRMTLQALFPVQTKSSFTTWCFGIQLDSGGKTHQIRAQCQQARIPLLGDRKYNTQTKHLSFSQLPPAYFLHAAVIIQKTDLDREKNDDEKKRQLPISMLPRTLVSAIPKNWYSYFKESSTRRNFERIQEGLTLLKTKLQDDNFFAFLLRRTADLESRLDPALESRLDPALKTEEDRDNTDFIAAFSSMFGSVRG